MDAIDVLMMFVKMVMILLFSVEVCKIAKAFFFRPRKIKITNDSGEEAELDLKKMDIDATLHFLEVLNNKK